MSPNALSILDPDQSQYGHQHISKWWKPRYNRQKLIRPEEINNRSNVYMLDIRTTSSADPYPPIVEEKNGISVEEQQ